MKNSATIRLVSQSPRRKELLDKLGFNFTTHSVQFDETFPPHLKGREVVEYILKKKLAAACDTIEEDGIILCADTVVMVDDRILGKPDNLASANAYLRLLSGREHVVLTAVAFSDKIREKFIYTYSKVTFENIPEKDIQYYTQNHEVMDKAGAYAIQGWIGHAYVSKIVGSYNSIMGLPTQAVYQVIQEWDKV